jgi:hypothetical protein
VTDGSRIGAARSRATLAKRGFALAAAAGFVVLLGVARQAHPGKAGSSSQLSPPGRISGEVGEDFSLGGGSIGSSSGSSSASPQVQSSSS